MPEIIHSILRRLCLSAGVFALCAGAHAQSSIEALATRADAVISVEVAFVPYGDLVLVQGVLFGQPGKISSANELLGECLPNKAIVRTLAAETPASAQADIYKEAIELAIYKAVIFLQIEEGTIRVICGNAIDSTENWESDPRHGAWRSELDAYLDERQ